MLRNSSEAPEVVPQATEKYTAEPLSYFDRVAKKKGSYYEKQLADVQTPDIDTRPAPVSGQWDSTFSYPYPPPGAPYDAQLAADKREKRNLFKQLFGQPAMVSEELQPPKKKRPVCGSRMILLLVILALIIGGAIAGGVAGSAAAKKKSRYVILTLSRLDIFRPFFVLYSLLTETRTSATSASESESSNSNSGSPESPSTSSPPSSTTTDPKVDAAKCPIPDGSTYDSKTSGSSFRVSCGWDVLPEGGSFINVANEVKTTFAACLDYCASYNADPANAALGGCAAATWVVSSPSWGTNQRCYLKNATGVPGDEGKQTLVTGYLLKST